MKIPLVILAWFLAVASMTAQESSALSEARARLAAGRPREAMKAFDAARTANPDLVEAHVGAARCLLRLGRHLEAIVLLEKAEKRFPENAEVFLALGQAYFQEARSLIQSRRRRTAGEIKFRLHDAVARCETATRLDPKNQRAYYFLGLAHLYLDPPEAEKAVAALLTAARLEADDPECHFYLGLAHDHTGKYDRAAQAYGMAANLYREKKDGRRYALTAFLRAGVCKAKTGDHDAAGKIFKAAYLLDPSSTATFQEIWKTYGSDRKRQEAGVQVLKMLDRSGGNSPLPTYYLAFMYEALGMKSECRESIESVLKTEEGARYPEAWARKGSLLYHEDRDEGRAERCCLKALELDAGNRTAYGVLQTMVSRHFAGRDLARAEDLTRKILRYQPKNGLEWGNLGLFLRDQRRYRESHQAYRKAVVHAPDRPQVLNDAGVVLHYHLDRTAEAMELYLRAVDLDPETVDALENLGVIHYDRAEYDRALEWFRKVVRIQPGRAKSLRYIDRIKKAAKITGPG